MSGTLDYETFQHFAEEFLAASTKLGDSWCLKQSQTKEIFLTKRDIVQNESKSHDSQNNENNFDGFYTYDYHIVYHHSYSVPVLYFNAYRPNGSLLKLEELWSRVPTTYKEQINQTKWTFLTQQDHLLLNMPYFFLHPCHTAEFMSSILSVSENKVNYLVPWLSTIGPLIGLTIKPCIVTEILGENDVTESKVSNT